jgi:hypothetical protein
MYYTKNSKREKSKANSSLKIFVMIFNSNLFLKAGVHLFPVLMKHHDAIKLYVRVEIQLQTFLTLALDVR